MRKIKSESGRSLLETLSVLVIIALLIVASLFGYDFVIRQYRKNQTVKEVSELVVRYKLRPVKAERFVQIKDIYPQADRKDAITMSTPDSPDGRVSLQVFDNSDSFAVVVDQVLDDTCRKILEEADYDVVVSGEDIEIDQATILNAFSRDYLMNDPMGQKIAEELCAQAGESHHMKKMGLIGGENCPTMGASYWYGGRCWNCASDRQQDNYGNCCAKGQVDECGYCPGKCPNGGTCNKNTKVCVECINDDNCAGRTDGKLKCDTTKNQCVECLNVGLLCEGTGPGTGKIDEYCTKYHVCQECDTTKHMRWNRDLDICECATPLIALGQTCFDGCCADGTTCHEGVCTGCWFDYDPTNPTKEGSCRSDRPLCNNGKCEGCPAVPTTVGASCSAICGCDASKGLGCENGICSCSANSTRNIWVPSKGLCCPSESNYGHVCDAETGTSCCSTGFCSEPGIDGKRLCCNAGEINSLGHCCPSGTEWEEKTGHCCAPGKTWKEGSTPNSGVCCSADEINVEGHCCPANKPFWDSSKKQCVECAVSPDCPVNKACVLNRCVPCNTSETGVRAKNEEYCSCPEGFTKKCGSTKTDKTCVDGGDWTCVKGCFDNTDCEKDKKCSCTGRDCPKAGGKCEPCPEGTHRRADSSDQCQACSECEEWDDVKGECVSMCSEGEICIQKGGNKKNPLMCGGYICQKMPARDKLLILVGTINKRYYYIPPYGDDYRMTHKAADSFCHYYGMHLPTVDEACLKDFKYDSGHDCPNIVAVKKWTDIFGRKVDLTKYNTKSSGDFWLANLDKDGNYALRVTHSCGNNHETHVCEKVYPLCATD